LDLKIRVEKVITPIEKKEGGEREREYKEEERSNES
jgi:hypothetical protein